MKKRLIFGVVLLLCTGVMGFAQDETENNSTNFLFSVGPSFGNSFINGSDLENRYIGSPGINMNFYVFFGENNIGLFFNLSGFQPTINNLEASAYLDFIPIGIGYGYKLNENIMFHFGFGPNVSMLFLHYKGNKEIKGEYLFGLGIGGDIGINYIFTNRISFDIGTTVSYNFTAYRELRRNVDFQNPNRDIEKSGWVNQYSMIGIKPYFSIGFNF